MKSALLSFLVFGVTLLSHISPAFSITIDTFQSAQDVQAQLGLPNTSTIASTHAIGGFRTINASVTSGAGVLSVTVANYPSLGDIVDHSQTLNAQGISTTHWDGNNSSTINPAGLGGIDLTEDGGTAFVFDALAFDATAVGLTVTVRVFDASDSSGDKFSDLSLTLPNGGSGLAYTLPFASPAATGTNGGADFTNVGAISLVINGNIEGADVGVKGFHTNGNCSLIPPIGGKVLDDCGECFAPSDPLYNQSCADCDGVPNGTTLPGSVCETKEAGPCSTGVFNQSCECVRTLSPAAELCDGADNNCDGNIDEIFPQLGRGCGIETDTCKVIGAYVCDSIGGIRCDVDFSQSILDGCGIEIGCDGVPGSGLKPDECGICGGDGTSCEGLDCDATDISELLFQLDGGAKEQEARIKSMLKIVSRQTKRKRIQTFVDETRLEANRLQIANWILSWTLPIISVQCDSVLASEVCVFNDNSTIVNNYIRGSEALRDLGLVTARKVRKVTNNAALAKRWRKRVEKRHQNNLNIAAEVPETQAVCVATGEA